MQQLLKEKARNASAPGPVLSSRCRLLLKRLKIHGRRLAAPIHLKLELKTVALVQADHARPFHGRDVNERVRLSIVATDEAEALHRVEELDRSRSLFAGQLTLRTAAVAAAEAAAGLAILARRAFLDRKRIAFDLEVGRRDAPA